MFSGIRKFRIFKVCFVCFFQLIGMTVCAIGLWAWTEKDTLNNIGRLTNIALDPAMLFILSGGVMFIIGFAGCVGALRENTCLLMFVSICTVTFQQIALIKCKSQCFEMILWGAFNFASNSYLQVRYFSRK